MRKILITTGCVPEEPWRQVLDISEPRFQKYAVRHGYAFSPIWYGGMNVRFNHLFKHPEQFIEGVINYEVRKDFILWNRDRSMLAPNWLRYAWTIQFLETYDLVLYLDGDVVIADFDTDIASVLQEGKWLATPINGPSLDNAGPGGPIYVVRSCEESKRFWWKLFFGQDWKRHPLWTDGVDLFSLLGYTITEPIHKVRETEWDQYFQALPPEWMAWHPARGKFIHIGGGNGNPAGKANVMSGIVRELG